MIDNCAAGVCGYGCGNPTVSDPGPISLPGPRAGTRLSDPGLPQGHRAFSRGFPGRYLSWLNPGKVGALPAASARRRGVGASCFRGAARLVAVGKISFLEGDGRLAVVCGERTQMKRGDPPGTWASSGLFGRPRGETEIVLQGTASRREQDETKASNRLPRSWPRDEQQRGVKR